MELTKVEKSRSGTAAEEQQQDLHIHAYLLRGFCAGGRLKRKRNPEKGRSKRTLLRLLRPPVPPTD
jgi:hypothetical protein